MDDLDYHARAARRVLENGGAQADVVGHLCRQGLSLRDAERVVRDLYHVSPDQARAVVAAQPEWGRMRERNRAVHARLAGAVTRAEHVRVLLRAYDGLTAGLQAGARDEQMDAFATRQGVALPPEMRAWLGVSNGSLAGPGGLFGLRPTGRHVRDIEAELQEHPSFARDGWLPIAGDGCGSLYALVLRPRARVGRPVLFLDHESSREELYDTPTYIAASGLWPFLRFLLMDDLELLDWQWPFDEGHMRAEDPGIIEHTTRRYPGKRSRTWAMARVQRMTRLRHLIGPFSTGRKTYPYLARQSLTTASVDQAKQAVDLS